MKMEVEMEMAMEVAMQMAREVAMEVEAAEPPRELRRRMSKARAAQ